MVKLSLAKYPSWAPALVGEQGVVAVIRRVPVGSGPCMVLQKCK